MNKYLISVLVLLVVVFGFFVSAALAPDFGPESMLPQNFEDCVKAGNPVMESYPRQCRSGENLFVEGIGNELEKTDLIRLDNPRPNQVLKSPLVIRGEARGTWFFEAVFPIVLTDWDGRIIAQS